MAPVGYKHIEAHLTARHGEKTYPLGTIPVYLPLNADPDDPTRLTAGPMEPALAQALRDAADELDPPQ